MKSFAILIVLLVGIAIGVAATVYGPGYVEPLLPWVGKAAKGGIEGQVTQKRLERDRLLVTLKSPEGMILVTFREKIPEIDLLVEKGDMVTLKIKGYRPFVDDPGINMVRKPEQKEAIPAPKAEEPIQMEKPEQKEAEPVKAEPPETGQPMAEEEAAPVSNSTSPVPETPEE